MTRCPRTAGFTLLPVILALSLIAAIAFLLNRSNAFSANAIAGRSDTERARYAAEAGLQVANYTVQQLGCAGGYPVAAAPLSDSSFGGSAYSAYASAAAGSPLTLTSTGTYNGATVTLKRNNVYAYQPGIRSYVHQPGAVLGVDTYVESANPDANFGLSSELAISGSGLESLLKFDLSFFPPGSQPVPYYDAVSGQLAAGARLDIYKTTSGTGTPNPSYIDAHLISPLNWVEGDGGSISGASWNKYDGVKQWHAIGKRYDERPISTNVTQGAAGWQAIELTDAVRAWMGPVYFNSGVWLRSSPTGDPVPSSRYHSSDYTSQASLRPRLNINYLLPCGATAPPPPIGVSLTLFPIADGHMSNAAPNASFGTDTSLSVFETGTDTRRALLKFDLSAIPPGQLLASASLRMNSTGMANASNSTKTITAYGVMQSWTEGTTSTPGDGMSWQYRDGVTPWLSLFRLGGSAMAADDLTGISPPNKWFTTGWLSWNLKGLAQEWVDGITTNHGIVLISTVRDKPAFASREGAAAARPQLVITY